MLYDIFLIIFLAVVAFRLFRYFSTPLLRKIGFYRYYSPLFLIMPIFPGTFDLHLGTSWDFFRHKGQITPRKILQYLAQGLNNLCTDIESGAIKKNIIIRGNTHYMNEKTLKRFGFEVHNMNIIEWILFFQNYPELCLLQSLSYGRITLISLKNAKIVKVKAAQLLLARERIREMAELFERHEEKEKAKLEKMAKVA